MKKIIMLGMLIALLALPFGAFAGTNNINTNMNAANSGASASSDPSNSIVQNSTSDPGTGRWFAQPVQPFVSNLIPYLGPWSSGSNIMESMQSLPEMITLSEAEKSYQGGVSSRINQLSDGSYQYKVIRLMESLPMIKLVDANGNPIKDFKGNEQLIPNEKRFKRVAYIFLKGNNDATTVDVLSKAVIEAVKLKASGIVLLKKVTTTSTSSSGWGIGLSSVSASLQGTALQNAQTQSAGTGFSTASAKPIYAEGMIVLAIQEIEPVSKPTATTSESQTVTQTVTQKVTKTTK